MCCVPAGRRPAGRFRRGYVQLDCAVGERISHIHRVSVGEAVAAWRCGTDADSVAGQGQVGADATDEARAACVGRRTCRVRLGDRRALAIEGVCEPTP